MIYAKEIATILGVSKEKAYKVVKELNNELSKQGYVTIAGRLPRRFWIEKFYGEINTLCTNE